MDEDFFSDDDLDNIPGNTLHALEQNAISSTQHPTSVVPLVGKQRSLHRSHVDPPSVLNKNVPWRPSQHRQEPTDQPAQNAPPASAPDPPSSDYGFDDEDVIDLDEPPTVIAPAPGLQARPVPMRAAPSADGYSSRAPAEPSIRQVPPAADAESDSQQGEQWEHAPHLQPPRNVNLDVSSLQARIAELEAEQVRLRQSEQEARNAALVRKGEISIVRSNLDKATKDYERRIAVMQKQHADEAARQRAELETGRKEREKIETDNRFLHHDLAQEAEKAKRPSGPDKTRAAVYGTATPRKSKRANLGDGFEEDEVRMVSPSKSKDKAKEQTPKLGPKRKRSAQDSPISALSFTQPQLTERQDSFEQGQVPSGGLFSPAASIRQVDRYEYMQRLINHRPHRDHERSLEALSKHAFPSDAGISLTSLLLDDLSFSRVMADTQVFPLHSSFSLLKLWSRCLEEAYYSPLYLILDMLRLALVSELSSLVSKLVEEAVPLCIKSIDLIAVPIGRASTNPAFAAGLNRQALEKLAEDIDVDEILDFLHQLCQAASLSNERIEAFWRCTEFTFTLLMLNKAQPISQILTSLQILATSALPTTFGPISSEPERQAKQEKDTIDRLTVLLFEMPEVPKDEPVYSELEIAELRVEVLKVLRAMCLTSHGGLILAQHRSAVGRLIRFLDGQINKLYNVPPSLGFSGSGVTAAGDDQPQNPSAHDLIVQTVNMTTRLVYHLLRTHENTIEINEKLSVIHGGYHKFLISMSRIAFSEQLVFEHGIEDEVVEAAHSILDSILSPEEGEAIKQAVETPRGTRGTHPGVDTRPTTEGEDTMMSEPG